MNKLKIVTLLTKEKLKKWEYFPQHWDKYFEYEQIYDSPSKLREYVHSENSIDILFLDYKYFDKFFISYYHFLKKKSKAFKYVLVGTKPSKKDVVAFRQMADDIVYLDLDQHLVDWKILALLRRHWDFYSKRGVIIYKSILADFIDTVLLVDKEEVELTFKEWRLLRYLLNNIGRWVSREEVFKAVWKINDVDNTRTVDQMIFKLRKKVGKDLFHSNSRKEIMLK